MSRLTTTLEFKYCAQMFEYYRKKDSQIMVLNEKGKEKEQTKQTNINGMNALLIEIEIFLLSLFSIYIALQEIFDGLFRPIP